jgi:hypothetical protein
MMLSDGFCRVNGLPSELFPPNWRAAAKTFVTPLSDHNKPTSHVTAGR